MKKILICILAVLLAVPALAADSTGGTSGDAATPRVSIFSTTTDWQALTGLYLSEYNGRFVPDRKLIGRGLELYYLDAFPCYGLGYGVRVWLGQSNAHDGTLHIACIYPPSQIQFTWRNASRDATDGVSTGLLTCPVTADDNELVIDMSKCVKGRDWREYK